MKKFWNKIKTVLIISFWLACAGGLLALLGAAIQQRKQLTFSGIGVHIDQSNGMLFLDQQDVFNLLKDDQVNIDQSKPVNEINYYKIERVIENNPYVKHAEMFVNTSGKVQINIVQRTPILRVINNRGVSYYIDEYARKMPLSGKFTARVPVATGNIHSGSENTSGLDSVTEKNLIVLARFIQSDTFLTSLTEQIVVNNQKELELIPRIGNHAILVGDADNLEEKFSKLKIFYREGLNRVGWKNYSQVNLKYRNEVYCKKRSSE